MVVHEGLVFNSLYISFGEEAGDYCEIRFTRFLHFSYINFLQVSNSLWQRREKIDCVLLFPSELIQENES